MYPLPTSLPPPHKEKSPLVHIKYPALVTTRRTPMARTCRHATKPSPVRKKRCADGAEPAPSAFAMLVLTAVATDMGSMYAMAVMSACHDVAAGHRIHTETRP
jgi:hypothetical protein